jgi:integrase
LPALALGEIRNRSGDAYKPSALRGYDEALRLRLLPMFGPHRRRHPPRRLATTCFAHEHGRRKPGDRPQHDRASARDLPALHRRRPSRCQSHRRPGPPGSAHAARPDATPVEAAELLAVLVVQDRALWATAIYAGLRRGELRALSWEDIDLATNTIRVERSYDPVDDKVIPPKSQAGTRTVPIPSELCAYLLEHKRAHGWAEHRHDGLVFGRTAARASNASSVSAAHDVPG